MARVTVASSNFSFVRQERNMMCWQDTGNKDQVGNPSPAGPGILEPVRDRGKERGLTSSPQPGAPTSPQQDILHHLLLQDSTWATEGMKQTPTTSPDSTVLPMMEHLPPSTCPAIRTGLQSLWEVPQTWRGTG